jgi:hypothetical protein
MKSANNGFKIIMHQKQTENRLESADQDVFHRLIWNSANAKPFITSLLAKKGFVGGNNYETLTLIDYDMADHNRFLGTAEIFPDIFTETNQFSKQWNVA